MKVKIEDIFLTYANNSLRDNPKIFYKIIEYFKSLEFIEIEDYKLFSSLSGEESKSGFMAGIIKYFVELVECEDLQTAIKIRKTEKFIENEMVIDAEFFQIAYQAVFGYADGYCEGKHGCCYNYRPFILGVEQFTGPDRIKCYECDQLFFRYMLEGIVKGKEYSEISELVMFLGNAHISFTPRVFPNTTASKSPFKENLEKKIRYIPTFFDAEEYKLAFRAIFIKDIVGYSLCEFLLNNDRRKLKKCDKCENFFVASRVDDRIKYCGSCSPKSKMSKEERKAYQRKYRQKKKQEKLTRERETRIENLMKRAGCSREEAIEYIEADSMM